MPKNGGRGMVFFLFARDHWIIKNETRRYQLHVGITVWEDGAATRYSFVSHSQNYYTPNQRPKLLPCTPK